MDNVGVSPSRSEDQNFLPNVLLFVLKMIWANRNDWFFGVDMGIYYTKGTNIRLPVIPDGFLSLGVERWKPKRQGRGRLSYVMWEENEIPPILTLELVSHTYGNEYDEKMEIYARLGVLYYIIYNSFWRRDCHQPFEVYKLVNGKYQLQSGEPYWMSEVGLGIGRYTMPLEPTQQEGLAW
ncbi:Uma2 family endonuclease [Gloeocapsa sp. PCC 7428]|uniref:Uma2 family endonuclease n=1 Tax=Gloeocapsa sp. PCC 7428 TaxID=1173026 RepID=UPI0030D9FB27